MSNRLNTRVVHCWILSSLFTWSRGIFYSIILVEVNFKYLSKPSEHIKCSKFRRGTGLLLFVDRFYVRHYAGVERGCFPCHVHVSFSHGNDTEFHISRFLTLYSLLQMNRNLETYKSLSKCLYYRSTHLRLAGMNTIRLTIYNELYIENILHEYSTLAPEVML